MDNREEEIAASFEYNLSLSDSEYVEELQIQEILEYSFSNLPTPSSSTKICCKICLEDKENYERFPIKGCTHSFCIDCISKLIESKLQEKNAFVSCPDENCPNIIEPNSLKSIIPEHVISRWDIARIESDIPTSEKVYCPYSSSNLPTPSSSTKIRCKICLEDKENYEIFQIEGCTHSFCIDFISKLIESKLQETNAFVSCPDENCPNSLKVPWHKELDCAGYRRSEEAKKDQEQFQSLANQNQWKECPSCKFVVERTEGCIHMTCRCKSEFCYVCGSEWDGSHWKTCQIQTPR